MVEINDFTDDELPVKKNPKVDLLPTPPLKTRIEPKNTKIYRGLKWTENTKRRQLTPYRGGFDKVTPLRKMRQ